MIKPLITKYEQSPTPPQVVMVNSSWTRAHIQEVWGVRRPLERIPLDLPWPLEGWTVPQCNWRRWIGKGRLNESFFLGELEFLDVLF